MNNKKGNKNILIQFVLRYKTVSDVTADMSTPDMLC